MKGKIITKLFSVFFLLFFISLIIATSVSDSSQNNTSSNAGFVTKAQEVKEPDFTIDQTFLRVLLKKDKIEKKELAIKSIDNVGVSIIINQNLDFVSTEEEVFIDKGEEKRITLNFLSNKTGVFTGTLILRSSNVVKELPILVEAETSEVLADVKIDANTKFKEVVAGDTLVTEVSILNFMGKKEDIFLNYKILDMNNNEIVTEHETLAVINKAALIKSIYLPSYLKEGDYVIAAEVKYQNSTGTSSFLFHVSEEGKKIFVSYLINYKLYLLVFILILIVVIFFYLNYRELKGIENLKAPIRIYKTYKRDETSENARIATAKLAKQLAILENAFKSGYITEKSYKIVKARIEKMLNSVKNKLKET